MYPMATSVSSNNTNISIPEIPSSTHPDSTPELRFLQWLDTHYRINLSHIDWPAHFANGGRGIGTVHDVSSNKVVLSVPESLMFTSKRCRSFLQTLESSFCSSPFDGTTDLWNNDEYILTLFLLTEISKGTESFYFPYLQCLPSAEDFIRLPWTWLPSQRDYLRDKQWIHRITERRNDIVQRYEQTVKILRYITENNHPDGLDGKDKSMVQKLSTMLNWSFFSWCTACVQSRVFTYGFATDTDTDTNNDPFSMLLSSDDRHDNASRSDMEMSLTMIPFIDMLNHLSNAYTLPPIEPSWIEPKIMNSMVKSKGSDSTIDAEWLMLDEYNSLARKDPTLTKSLTHDTEIGYYVLRTNYTGLKKGSQIYTYYGDLSSQALLETYGFILPYGENDNESLTITLPTTLIPNESNPAYELYHQCDSPTELDLYGFPLIDDILFSYYRSCPEHSKDDLFNYIQSNYNSLVSSWHYEGPCTETQQCLRILALTDKDTELISSRKSVSVYQKPVNRDNELRSCDLLRNLLVDNIAKVYGEDNTPSTSTTSSNYTMINRNYPELVTEIRSATSILVQTELVTQLLIREEEILSSVSDTMDTTPTFIPFSTFTHHYREHEDSYPLWSPVGILWEPSIEPTVLPYHDKVRYRTALLYRTNFLRTHLVQFQYLCYVHFVANGIPVKHIPGNQILLSSFVHRYFSHKSKLSTDLSFLSPSFRIPYTVTKVSYGLEVQIPWSTYLLEKKKRIETRDYPLPAYLVRQPIALIEAPLGGLSKVGLDRGKIIGIVIFGACRHYTSRESWAKDSPYHCVDPSAAPHEYGWIDNSSKYGWIVQSVVPLTNSFSANPVLDESLRVYRSIFRLPSGIDIVIQPSDSNNNSSSSTDVALHIHDSSLYSHEYLSLHDQRSIHFTTRKRNADIMSSKVDLTGVVSWPATQLLGYVLSQYPILWANKCVIELGCGTGILSTVIATRRNTVYPAKCVLATDGTKDTLPIALYNMVRNESSEYVAEGTDCLLHQDTDTLVQGTAGSRLAIAPLIWGNETDIQYAQKYVQAFVSSNDRSPAFDLIVASEVFYLHRGGEENWGIEQQACSLFTTCRALFVKHGKTSMCQCHSATREETGTNSSVTHTTNVPCGLASSSGVLLLVYSPRYRNMAESILEASQKLQLFYRSVNTSLLLTPEQKASTLYTDTRMAIVSNCAQSITEIQNQLSSPLPLYPENYIEEDYYP